MVVLGYWKRLGGDDVRETIGFLRSEHSTFISIGASQMAVKSFNRSSCLHDKRANETSPDQRKIGDRLARIVCRMHGRFRELSAMMLC